MKNNTYTEKEYKYALSITSQFYFCGLPFRLDTTPKCSLNCVYCYAMSIGGRRTKPEQIANPEKLKRRFENLENKQNPNISDQFLKLKIPLHFGGMSDPFADIQTSKVSVELLKILSNYNYPTVLSTKNTDLLLENEVIKTLVSHKNLIVQISLSSLDKNFISKIEPSAPSPEKRIHAMKILSSENIPVFTRLQPFFPWRASEVIQELIPAICEAKSNHVTVEFLKLPIEKRSNPIVNISRACDFDVLNYYKIHHLSNVSREWQIPPNIKWDLIQPIINSLHEHNLTYGAGDYGLNHLGDTDCCCGVDKVLGFSDFFKGNFAYFIRKSTPNTLCWRNFSKNNFPENSIKRYIMSESRLKNVKNNLYEFLKNKWNNPNSVNSPDSYLGVKFTHEYDDQGDCVYEKVRV